MNGTEEHWKKAMYARFEGRDDLGKDGFYSKYYAGSGIGKDAVLELLELIDIEYNLSPGLLRPEDNLSKLIDPVPTRNVWRWLVYRARAEDRQSELNYRLAKRAHQYGTSGKWSRIETVDDLIRAWCGAKPR